MKTLTKTLLLILSLVLLIQTPVLFGQEDAPNTENVLHFEKVAIQRYIDGLRFDNNGVVEAATFYALKLKLFHPEWDTTNLEREFARLVKKGETETIRFKAYIALQYMKNPALFSKIEKKDYKNDSDEFFRVLTSHLQQHYLIN